MPIENLFRVDFRVVESNLPRHTVEKPKEADKRFLKRFHTFFRKRLNVTHIAVRQGNRRIGNFLQDTADHGIGKAKIELGFTRRMRKRHIKSFLLRFHLLQGFANGAIATGITLLIAETLENTLLRVPLLPMRVLAFFQIALDERQKRSEFRVGTWRTCVRVGLDILGNLVDGTKVTALAVKKFTEPGAEAPVLPHRALLVLC